MSALELARRIAEAADEVSASDGASRKDAIRRLSIVTDNQYGVVQIARALLSTSAAERGMREALIDATAHLAGAASAYRKYARRHRGVGQSEIDPFFATRADDFDKAVERSRAALSHKGEDTQATRADDGPTAPTPTDTKDTTNA